MINNFDFNEWFFAPVSTVIVVGGKKEPATNDVTACLVFDTKRNHLIYRYQRNTTRINAISARVPPQEF